MKKVLALILVLVMVLSLTACGNDGVEGDYVLTGMEENGEDMFEMMQGLLAMAGMDGDLMTLELSGGKFTIASSLDDSLNVEGTYTQDGDKLVLTADGESHEVTYGGGKIVMEMEGTVLTFEKD